MKKYTVTELQKGEIYASNNGSGLYVFMSMGENKYAHRVIEVGTYATNSSFGGSTIIVNLREATSDEKAWLLYCIKAEIGISWKAFLKKLSTIEYLIFN